MFLAIEFGKEDQDIIAKELYLPLPKKQLLRVKRRNFHLTLGFIKDVKIEDRQQVIGAFEEMKNIEPFALQILGTVGFGQYGHILCAKLGPDELLQQLSQRAAKLLAENTDYRFDESFESYIPHLKIQTINRNVSNEDKAKIKDMFACLDTSLLKIRVKNFALMQRVGYNFETLTRYPMSAANFSE